MSLTDTLGRPIRDLRVSVTDRCNFRCGYCMPKEVFGPGYQFLKPSSLLSYEEIARLAGIFVGLGVGKIRLTGGEPLVRRKLERLIEMLAAVPGLDLALTTNGSLLESKAQALKDAGLQRITVSLDSLDDAVFAAMNGVGFPVGKVLAGIEAASVAGLWPVKINMVVKKGLNDDSVLPMARFFRGTGHILRFIEYMDVGNSNGWQMNEVVTANEIVAMIDDEFPLEAIDPGYQGEVAKRWRYRDGSGEIGVIASVSQPFCRDCTRARLSSEGELYTCLFATRGHDLRGLLRSDASDADICEVIAGVWQARGDRYSETRSVGMPRWHKVEMSHIGG